MLHKQRVDNLIEPEHKTIKTILFVFTVGLLNSNETLIDIFIPQG